MADSKRHLDWFNKANADLESAEILFKNDGNNAVIAFLCQQAIEKAYKGFILKEKEELFEGHSLIYLCKKIAEFDISFKQFMKDSAYVNQFYLETRYPADIPLDISESEAQECIEIAKKIMDKVIG